MKGREEGKKRIIEGHKETFRSDKHVHILEFNDGFHWCVHMSKLTK